MYCEMQTLIHEGSGMVIPAFSNINDGIANNVMGMPTVPLGQLGACEWPEFMVADLAGKVHYRKFV